LGLEFETLSATIAALLLSRRVDSGARYDCGAPLRHLSEAAPMLFKTVVLFVSILFSLRSAWAAETPALAKAAKPPADLFVSMDFDRDDRVNREELRNFMARLFTDQDNNRDGSLTPKELPDAVDADGKRIAKKKVRVEDMIGASDIAFDNLDKNQDGFLTREEMNIPVAPAQAKN